MEREWKYICTCCMYPGERNRGVPHEVCCSSETTRYCVRLCQFVLNRANCTIVSARFQVIS